MKTDYADSHRLKYTGYQKGTKSKITNYFI